MEQSTLWLAANECQLSLTSISSCYAFMQSILHAYTLPASHRNKTFNLPCSILPLLCKLLNFLKKILSAFDSLLIWEVLFLSTFLIVIRAIVTGYPFVIPPKNYMILTHYWWYETVHHIIFRPLETLAKFRMKLFLISWLVLNSAIYKNRVEFYPYFWI